MRAGTFGTIRFHTMTMIAGRDTGRLVSAAQGSWRSSILSPPDLHVHGHVIPQGWWSCSSPGSDAAGSGGSRAGGRCQVVAALIDRLVHHAEVITLDGRSYRTRTRRESDEQNRIKKIAIAS